jgi:hypothetical protein
MVFVSFHPPIRTGFFTIRRDHSISALRFGGGFLTRCDWRWISTSGITAKEENKEIRESFVIIKITSVSYFGFVGARVAATAPIQFDRPPKETPAKQPMSNNNNKSFFLSFLSHQQ